jgi:hypothetical protein
MADMFTTLDLPVERSPGSFGVEIEVEGQNLPRRGPFTTWWRAEADPSLRGEDTVEYVSKKALTFHEVEMALWDLDNAYIEKKSVVDESVRAGVHVHLNVQTLTPLELMTFITTYYCLEDHFVRWCGVGRVGNHFCLRVQDAEEIVSYLMKTAQSKDWRHLNTEDIRYSSLNLLSLFKYGTVEFRSMQGTRDLNRILTWVKLINQLSVGAKKFRTPTDVIHGLSDIGGPEEFLKFVMGDLAGELKGNGGDIIKSMRFVQPLAFLVDWDAFAKPKVNPFPKAPEVFEVAPKLGFWVDEDGDDF